MNASEMDCFASRGIKLSRLLWVPGVCDFSAVVAISRRLVPNWRALNLMLADIIHVTWSRETRACFTTTCVITFSACVDTHTEILLYEASTLISRSFRLSPSNSCTKKMECQTAEGGGGGGLGVGWGQTGGGGRTRN